MNWTEVKNSEVDETFATYVYFLIKARVKTFATWRVVFLFNKSEGWIIKNVLIFSYWSFREFSILGRGSKNVKI